jgi:hypothetical protein
MYSCSCKHLKFRTRPLSLSLIIYAVEYHVHVPCLQRLSNSVFGTFLFSIVHISLNIYFIKGMSMSEKNTATYISKIMLHNNNKFVIYMKVDHETEMYTL